LDFGFWILDFATQFPLPPTFLVGWISCRERIFNTFVLSLYPPASDLSPLKWTFASSPHFRKQGRLVTKHQGLVIFSPDN
jgi:hypothetical protein